MKISEPPTFVAKVPDVARSASDVMQAVLFSEILKPLATALGPLGETLISSVAQHAFVKTQP